MHGKPLQRTRTSTRRTCPLLVVHNLRCVSLSWQVRSSDELVERGCGLTDPIAQKLRVKEGGTIRGGLGGGSIAQALEELLTKFVSTNTVQPLYDELQESNSTDLTVGSTSKVANFLQNKDAARGPPGCQKRRRLSLIEAFGKRKNQITKGVESLTFRSPRSGA